MAAADFHTRVDKDGAGLSVRPLHSGDRDRLVRFYGDFQPKRAAHGLPPLGEHRIARWLDAILSSGEHLIVMRSDRLIGHAFLLPTEREGVAEYAIFIQSDERGRGIGTALHRLAAQTAAAAGYKRIWLTVEPHNRAAIRSYENAGFCFTPATILAAEAEMELDLKVL